MPTTIRQAWMLEVVCWIMGHAEAFHYTARAHVLWHRERDNFLQRERAKSERNRGARCFCRIAASPEVHSNTPAHLNARREMGLERRNCKTHKSDEWASLAHLHGPQPEAMAIEMRSDALDQSIALGTRQSTREVLHHSSISVEI